MEDFTDMSEKVKVKVECSINSTVMPCIALRGLVVFPNNIIHFEVGREKSIAAVNWAMENNSDVFLIAQKEMNVENPTTDDLYKFGVVATVKQILKVSSNLVKVLVEGKHRARLIELMTPNPDYLVARTKFAKVALPSAQNIDKAEAISRQIKEAIQEYVHLAPRLPKEIIYSILSSEDLEFISQFVPSNLLFKYQDKQAILDQNSVIARIEKILDVLLHEINILSIEREIQDKTSEQIDKSQRDYYLREQLNTIAEELGEYENTKSEAEEYKAKILKLKLCKDTTEKLLKETERLAKMQGSSQESTVIRSYLDTCLDLPWQKVTKEQLNIEKAEQILNRDHYGLKKVKERILEILAVRKLNSDIKGQIICLVGPPGIGKTSIAKSIAQGIGRNYARISLGGVRDEAEIRGHRRTYIGAMPGKLINTLISAKTKNPLILLDEIDKLSNDFRGDPSAALLEALDPEQNSAFRDHYLDVPFDLSDVLFITTANNLDTIPRPLLDRMDVIQLYSYTREEKFNIAKKHLIPKQLVKTGLKGKVKFNKQAVYLLIDSYTSEAGVRNLERTISEVLRKCAKQVAIDETLTFSLNSNNVEELLGPKRKKPSYFNRTNAVGIANGLAWTSVGGEILPIEVEILENGKGNLELTGSLGDVMKESAKLAFTFAKANAVKYNIKTENLSKIDIHIHAPEGAVPKDGPSAGITLTTALISALSNTKVNSHVAMTGEITLHGEVLPIGGLKEKSMAAYKEGIKKVIIPKDNISDLYEVDEIVKENVEFIPVQSLEQALKITLEN